MGNLCPGYYATARTDNKDITARTLQQGQDSKDKIARSQAQNSMDKSERAIYPWRQSRDKS